MTTGSFQIGFSGTPWPGAGQQRVWEGSDGKLEIYQGSNRVKWNEYHSQATTRFNVKLSDMGYNFPGFFHPFAGIGSSGNPWTNNDDLKLLSNLSSLIKQHSLNLGVAVAEGKMTVGLVVSNLRKLGTAMLALKRGDFSAAARALGASDRVRSKLDAKDIAGRWLELQYGWLPLMSDCFEAASAFESITNGFRTVRIKVKRSVKLVYPWSFAGDIHYVNCRQSRAIIYEATEELSAQRKLGLTDPISIAWELIPYSFVVDWFIPIGTYFEVLSIVPFLQGRFLNTESRSFKATSSPITHPVWSGATISERTTYVDRVPMSSVPVPFPGFKSVPDAMSSRHIWNAIALARQRFR